MAQKKASLACTECGSRNYSIGVSSNPKPVRLEVNKFCKHCKKSFYVATGILSFRVMSGDDRKRRRPWHSLREFLRF